MIIVTGGAGFIGSNLIRALNKRGESNILLVDHLVNGRKMLNIADLNIADYMDKAEFIDKMDSPGFLNGVKAVFHQGACSATTEWNGQYVMENNYTYSKRLLQACIAKNVAFIYASSASVYGNGEQGFRVDRSCEQPINMYAYSHKYFNQVKSDLRFMKWNFKNKSKKCTGLGCFVVEGKNITNFNKSAYEFSNYVNENTTSFIKSTDKNSYVSKNNAVSEKASPI